MRHKAPGPIVEVEWVDSMGHRGWQPREEAATDLEDPDILRHRTTGYLFRKTKKYLAINQSYGIGGSGMVDAVLQIPRSAVVIVRVLDKQPSGRGKD